MLVEAFNRMAESAVSVDQVIADAETTGRGYLVTWLETAGKQSLGPALANLLTLLAPSANDVSTVKTAIEAILGQFAKDLLDRFQKVTEKGHMCRFSRRHRTERYQRYAERMGEGRLFSQIYVSIFPQEFMHRSSEAVYRAARTTSGPSLRTNSHSIKESRWAISF